MIRLSVRCASEQAEFVLAELSVLAPGGVEQVDDGDSVEFAIYGAEGELPEVGDLEATLGESRIALSSSRVDEGWETRWKEFHRPVTVPSSSGGSSIWIGPPWSEAPGGEAVAIDPGMAFGTGAHPTTRICLGFLLDLAERGDARGSLADIGSGSGVLAIAAAQLGFNPVFALDSERAAVEATSANASLNDTEPVVSRIDLRSDPLPEAETLVANLTGPLLITLVGRLRDGKLPSRIACSGFLAAERERVGDSFGSLGFRPTATGESEGWSGLLLES
ncbi:MAG: 50S ribosomal protein L11 methyltransferase [Solirubrobacterales bacterium]